MRLEDFYTFFWFINLFLLVCAIILQKQKVSNKGLNQAQNLIRNNKRSFLEKFCWVTTFLFMSTTYAISLYEF